MKLYQIVAPLLALGCATVPTVNGQKQRVDYFFAPSCSPCQETEKIVDELERRYGHQINLERYCGISTIDPQLDERVCQLTFKQNSIESTNMLQVWGGERIPAIYVNQKVVEPKREVICRALGLDENCLD